MKDEDKIYHVLMGIAYGDALGMPTENFTQTQIREKFGYVDDFIDAPEDGPINRYLPAGKITDDTENSIFISKMLIETQGNIDSQNFVNALMEWLDTDKDAKSVTGPSTLAAVEAIKKGVPLSLTGRNGTTNGAAMKIGPLGLITDYRDIPSLVTKVKDVCIPTHNTQIAIQGAAVVAVAVNYFFNNKIINWDEFFEIVYETAEQSSKYGNQIATPNIIERIRYGKQLADSLSEDEFLEKLYSFLGTGLPTIETVPAVISLVYKYKGDLRKTVLAGANIGGDTDTIAAIGGAICGGYNFNMEQKTIDKLNEVNNLEFSRLAHELAELTEKRTSTYVNK